MSDVPIVDIAPVVYKHNPKKPWGASYCQWTYQELESLGLIKMDFLSLSDLDIVEETLRNIRRTHDGNAPDMHELIHGAMDDKATYEMLGRGDTIGVFQCSSAGMASLFKRMKPTTFNDIMASVALYRPGPMGMEAHTEYALRKSGESKPYVINAELDPSFHGTPAEKILAPTLGLVVYQDQVMNISRLLSGFSWGDADILRKGMGHKIIKTLNEMGPKFINGALNYPKNGNPNDHIDANAINELWNYLKKFGEYGFNKSHSASYGIITYETAWLKCHYPAEFMAAIMTDKFRKANKPTPMSNEREHIINEAREMGLKVASVDINNSGIGMSPVRKRTPDDPDVVFGLAGIKGISESVANEIISIRDKQGAFTSIDDFLSSLPPRIISSKLIDGIGGTGGFDAFHVSRHAVCAESDGLSAYYKTESKKKAAGKRSLFDDIDDDEPDRYEIPEINEWDWITMLEQEEDRLGVIVTGHPMSRLGPGFDFMKKGFMYNSDEYGDIINVSDLASMNVNGYALPNGRKRYDRVRVRTMASIGAMINKTTRRGDKILIGTIEDTSSSLQFRVRPEDYPGMVRNGLPLHNHIYLITGYMTMDWNDNIMLEPDSFQPMTTTKDGAIPLWIKLTDSALRSRGYEIMLDTLRKSPGSIPVLISVKDSNGSIREVNPMISIRYDDDMATWMEKSVGVGHFGSW